MPGLCSGEQREEPVPEVPAALQKGSLVRAPGSPWQQSPRHPPAPAVPTAALQTYESDVVLAPPAGRWGGCGVGAQPQGAPLLVQLPPARQRGGVRGWLRLRDPQEAAGGTYRRARFSARQRGSESSMLLRRLGERLSSSFASRLRLSGGTRGSVGHGWLGCDTPVPSPGAGTMPGSACPHPNGSSHLPAWRGPGRSPGRTAAGWAAPCG